jgi:hypothetical protein
MNYAKKVLQYRPPGACAINLFTAVTVAVSQKAITIFVGKARSLPLKQSHVGGSILVNSALHINIRIG